MVQAVQNNHTPGGKLFVCSTPIGNLSDISDRLLTTLRTVDIVACEDTRHTRKLLTHFDIHPPKVVSYHQHNEVARQDWMKQAWREGQSIALVSDAGTPLLSDPGAVLVDTAIDEGVPVIPIPGPSALLSALVGSGLPLTPFLYLGFAPRSKNAVKSWIEDYRRLQVTLVIYESPYRVRATLQFLHEFLGDKSAVLAKELTKQYESFVRGQLSELIAFCEETQPKGEYVIVVDNRGALPSEPNEVDAWAEALSYVHQRVADGERHKVAVQEAVRQFQVNRRDLYNATIDAGEDTKKG